jgi:prepilin-type N-terminal cleavage/methylation domain-containing protein
VTRGQTRRGFTLIEVVVVLLVLAVALAVGVPAIGHGADGLRSRSEAAGVANFLRAAREQAVTRNRVYEVRVGTEAGVPRADPSPADGTGRGNGQAARHLAAPVRIERSRRSGALSPFPPRLLERRSLPHQGAGAARLRHHVDQITGRVATRGRLMKAIGAALRCRVWSP